MFLSWNVFTKLQAKKVLIEKPVLSNVVKKLKTPLNLTAHYVVHSHPLFLILNRRNHIPTLTTYAFKILFNITLLSTSGFDLIPRVQTLTI